MNSDITAMLYRIKENIAEIESGGASTPLLDEVRTDFLEMVELIKLFLISERDSYYGYFMMNLRFEADFTVNSIAGIRLNSFPPVFVYNPLLLCKYSLKEILYIFCHEIDHIVLNHPAEMVKANPEEDPEQYKRFNLAADASVNDRINHEIEVEERKFLAQPDGSITSASLKKMFKLKETLPLESYAYYFSLIREDAKKTTQAEQMLVSIKERSCQAGEDADASVVTAVNCKELSDHDWQVGSDPEEAAAAVRELVNASVGMMNDESRGMMPGFFMSKIEEINKPPVLSWQAILKKYVGTIASSKIKTRTRLNRRQPNRFDISGEVADKVLKIVVAIDTSASVDDDQIAMIFNEIFAILAKRKHEITVIECDSQVQRVYRVRTIEDLQKKVAGRGGTCFTPVIEFINNNKYFRDALLIYFTDGFGERDIPKPRTYRNLWVVLNNADNLSLKEPYGAKITL